MVRDEIVQNMAEIICGECKNTDCIEEHPCDSVIDYATVLYNAGYRKVDGEEYCSIEWHNEQILHAEQEIERLRNEKWDAQDDLDCYHSEMEEVKMTKDEIKKALLIHTGDEADCAECPYYVYGECHSVELHNDVLYLIGEQKQEIERLKKEVKYWEDETKTARRDIDEAVNEVYKQAKIEVLELLKECATVSGFVAESDIDDFIEEIRHNNKKRR